MYEGRAMRQRKGERLRVRLVRKCRWRWERDAEVALEVYVQVDGGEGT
jgi:hypothetical protein